MNKMLKEFVTIAKNSKNKQEYLILKKKKLKKCDMNIDDLLNMKVKKKLNKFKEVM